MSVQETLADENKFTEVCQSAFDAVDTDKSGRIENSELSVALKDLATELGIDQPTDKDVNEVLAALDTDQSGNIDFNEFKVFIRQLLTNLV